MPQVTPEEIGWDASGATLDAFVATRHTASWGTTGMGKTTLEDRLCYQLSTVRRFVFNPEEIPFRGSKRVYDRKGLIRAIVDGHPIIDAVPDGIDDEYMPTWFDNTFEPIDTLGERLKGNKEKTDPWALIFGDEVDLLMPQDHNVAPSRLYNHFLRRGRKRGVFLHSSSQRPADVKKIVVTQSRAHFVFGLEMDDLMYLRRRRIPVDEFSAHIAQPYYFVVTERDKWCPFPPVPT